LAHLLAALISDPNTPQRPTLGVVRDARRLRFAVRVVGAGSIESVDEQTPVAELEVLIGRFSLEALAESFMYHE
jgi:hypothetical protein